MPDFNILGKLKQKLDSYRPLPPEIVANLHEDLVLRWTYNSNAIEDNTLTLKETKVALEGITVGGETMREHFEAGFKPYRHALGVNPWTTLNF